MVTSARSSSSSGGGRESEALLGDVPGDSAESPHYRGSERRSGSIEALSRIASPEENVFDEFEALSRGHVESFDYSGRRQGDVRADARLGVAEDLDDEGFDYGLAVDRDDEEAQMTSATQSIEEIAVRGRLMYHTFDRNSVGDGGNR